MTRRIAIAAAVGLLSALAGGSASAEDDKLQYGLKIVSDIRADVDRVEEPGFSRNENRVEGKVSYDANEHVSLVGALDVVFIGFSEDTKLMGLTRRDEVIPFFVECDAAYVGLYEVADGLDMRIGRQIVQWGAADMINPTDNLNPDDLEDPLMFGENIANQMIKIDYNPWDSMVFTAVWVPIFTPALLPQSANTANQDTKNEMPFASPTTRARAENLRAIWLNNPDAYELRTPEVHVETPDFSFGNSQVGLKAGWEAGGWDMSVSYYRGFDDIPVLTSVISDAEVMADERLGVDSEVHMKYPRIQVLGFDLSGQFPFLDDMGFWIEGAVFFPERVEMQMDLSRVVGGEPITGAVVEDTPFFKTTIGADYTPVSFLLLNAQYVHGFIDDFGSTNMGNYIVAGVDTKFLSDRLALRVFGIAELPREDTDIDLPAPELGIERSSPSRGAKDNGTLTSYVFFPQVTVNPWGTLELIGGGYFLFGDREGKFGQVAAGPSLVFLKAQAGF